jgi:sorting nexin-25
MCFLRIYSQSTRRKIRETYKSFLEETQVVSLIQTFRDALWPDGKLKPPEVPRTADEKDHTRDEANRKLSALVPGELRFAFKG